MKKISAFLIVLTIILSSLTFTNCGQVTPPETLLTSDPATSATVSTPATSAPETTPGASDTDDGKTTPTPTPSDIPVKETYGPVIVEGMLKYRLVNDSFYEVYGVDKIKHYEIEIPSEVRGKPVKRIKGQVIDLNNINKSEPGAFQSCDDIITVRIHEGITKIGDMAFSGCANLREIILPASVEKIEEGAFLSCSRLQSFCVAEDNSEYCSIDGVLFTKNGEKLLIYPAEKGDQTYQVPDGVKIIASNAFWNCTYLTSVITSESTETIEDSSILSCLSLKSIYISKNVNEIQSRALFGNIQFSSFEVNAENNTYKAVDGILFSKNGETIVHYPCAKSYEDYQIPEGVETIETCAFYECDFLINLRLPQSIQTIKESAISFNQSLETIYIPKNAETIEMGAILFNKNATVNCGAEEKPAGWDDIWQHINKAVVWGYTE